MVSSAQFGQLSQLRTSSSTPATSTSPSHAARNQRQVNGDLRLDPPLPDCVGAPVRSGLGTFCSSACRLEGVACVRDPKSVGSGRVWGVDSWGSEIGLPVVRGSGGFAVLGCESSARRCCFGPLPRRAHPGPGRPTPPLRTARPGVLTTTDLGTGTRIRSRGRCPATCGHVRPSRAASAHRRRSPGSASRSVRRASP